MKLKINLFALVILFICQLLLVAQPRPAGPGPSGGPGGPSSPAGGPGGPAGARQAGPAGPSAIQPVGVAGLIFVNQGQNLLSDESSTDFFAVEIASASYNANVVEIRCRIENKTDVEAVYDISSFSSTHIITGTNGRAVQRLSRNAKFDNPDPGTSSRKTIAAGESATITLWWTGGGYASDISSVEYNLHIRMQQSGGVDNFFSAPVQIRRAPTQPAGARHGQPAGAR